MPAAKADMMAVAAVQKNRSHTGAVEDGKGKRTTASHRGQTDGNSRDDSLPFLGASSSPRLGEVAWIRRELPFLCVGDGTVARQNGNGADSS